MPMLIPFMYFITSGLENVMEKVIKNNIAKRTIQVIITISPMILTIDCIVQAMQYYAR